MSGQHQVVGATELGFARSVLHLPDCSSVDRELVSKTEISLGNGAGPVGAGLKPAPTKAFCDYR
jgi:hypothetical protein